VIGLNLFLTPQAGAMFMIKKMAKISYEKDTNTFLKIQTLVQCDN